MIKEINLLPSVKDESIQIKRLKFFLTFGSPAIMIIFIIIVIAIYSYSLIQTQAVQGVATKIKNAESVIQSLSNVESYQRGSKIKLVTIKKILGAQIDYSEIIGRIQEITPTATSFVNLDIKGTKDITITYKTETSDTVSELINNLLEVDKGGKYFEEVKLKNLIFSKEGGFILTLSFKIKSQTI